MTKITLTEIKTTMAQMKNTLDGNNDRLDIVEKRLINLKT